MKNTLSLLLMLSVMLALFSSCNNTSNGDKKIVGTWSSATHGTMTLGTDGSYYRTLGAGGVYIYYKGTYSYNENQCILVTNINETSFSINGQTYYGPSTQTYIVQTLTETTLVLLYTDGDSAGYFTKN